MNGVQRLLILLLFYNACSLGHDYWSHLKDIRDRNQVAEALTRVFGDMSEDIAKGREIYGNMVW